MRACWIPDVSALTGLLHEPYVHVAVTRVWQVANETLDYAGLCARLQARLSSIEREHVLVRAIDHA